MVSLPDGYKVKMNKALQGYPESPRLCVQLINNIITILGFTACKHEPCLYYHPDYKGEETYFIRQVDDFVIRCKNKHTSEHIIDVINKQMTIKLKLCGTTKHFRGIDIDWTGNYIKLYNAMYLRNYSKTRDNPNIMHIPTHCQ